MTMFVLRLTTTSKINDTISLFSAVLPANVLRVFGADGYKIGT